jgi:hypothetical protein
MSETYVAVEAQFSNARRNRHILKPGGERLGVRSEGGSTGGRRDAREGRTCARTILFLDLVGSTDLAGRSVTGWRDLLAPLHRGPQASVRARRRRGRHGGRRFLATSRARRSDPFAPRWARSIASRPRGASRHPHGRSGAGRSGDPGHRGRYRFPCRGTQCREIPSPAPFATSLAAQASSSPTAACGRSRVYRSPGTSTTRPPHRCDEAAGLSLDVMASLGHRRRANHRA